MRAPLTMADKGIRKKLSLAKGVIRNCLDVNSGYGILLPCEVEAADKVSFRPERTEGMISAGDKLVVLAAVLVCTASGVGGVSDAPWYMPEACSAASAAQTQASCAGICDAVWWLVPVDNGFDRPLGDRSVAADPFEGLPSAIRPLPVPPDGAALVLCGLGGLAGWHALRSARKIPWGYLPEWYHSGAPRQIRHIHVLDLDRLHVLPMCLLPPIISPNHLVWLERLTNAVPSPRMRGALSVVGPRPPPALPFPT